MTKKKTTYRVLAINPGSTSTKIGLYDDEVRIFEKVIRHDAQELADLLPENGDLKGQREMRRRLILSALREQGVPTASIDATVGRGGRMPPLKSGTYLVNDAMLADLPDPLPHPAPLGAILARELGDEWGVPAYMVDSTSVDEFEDVARITGVADIRRVSNFHALNQKMCGRRYARENGTSYEKLRLVIAHMGGGISIGAHSFGRVVDATHPNGGEGPLSPERSGAVPAMALVRLCYSGKYTLPEMNALLSRRGGMRALVGTSDMVEVENRIEEGDDWARLCYDAMGYTIAKHIGMIVAVLGGQVDAIILTGGLAHSGRLCDYIAGMVAKMAGSLVVYPGEDELMAMAHGALRVLRGDEELHHYESPEVLAVLR